MLEAGSTPAPTLITRPSPTRAAPPGAPACCTTPAATPDFAALIASFDDDALAALMTNLGGHCIETLTDAFAAAQDARPTLFIAYTIKGYGLPFAGHKDNHAGLMNPAQIDALRQSLGIPEGAEWDKFAGLGDNAAAALQAVIDRSPLRRPRPSHSADPIALPARLAVPEGERQSTQAAFGNILLDIAKSGDPLADRIVTTSPDVTVSTNLGAWVNQRGLFRRQLLDDVFRAARIPSAQKWSGGGAGQHIELGIAENNLFLRPRRPGPVRADVRHAPAAHRHGLRSVHRPWPRCAELWLLPGCPFPAGRHPLRRHARPRRRRPPIHQHAADRHRPARPDLFRTRLRR